MISTDLVMDLELDDAEFQVEARLLLARVALTRGKFAQAADLLAAAARSAGDVAAREAVAQQYVALARMWGKLKDDPGATFQMELALRQAIELDPKTSLSVYAQHLQREKRFAEAIDRWREAIAAEPGRVNHYLSLARAYELTHEPGLALVTYLQAIDAAPSARSYLTVAQRLDDLCRQLPPSDSTADIRVALLGNATLDHLQSYLKVEALRVGLRPEIYQCGFDQYHQDILNPESGLYEFKPDVVICAIHASRLFPRIHDYPFDMSPDERRAEIEEGVAEVQNLLDTLTERNSALVLFHNMVAPQYPALGILDWRDELGQAELFGQINARLASLARTRYKNVYIVDEDRVQARAGKAGATDSRMWLTGRIAWSEPALAPLAREYIRYIKPYKALSRKCIVLDLDNTLWGGVIGEDGVAGIQLGADAPGNAFVAFQRELERLWKRGILLAISSKNNQDDVLPVFEQPQMVLKRSHFASERINWKPKAENIREIAQELNIGLDSLVFLDDNPVERARVRAELPQVLVPELPTDPALYRRALLELDVFETLALTDEDRRRNQLYAEQRSRRELASGFEGKSGSVEEYLEALDMVVDIRPANEADMPRIAQLTNKTNQFNLTTHRYSEGELRTMEQQGCRIFSMRVADKFGDNGLVGVAIAVPSHPKVWELDTLLMSCRVMGRGVETAFLAVVAEEARASGVTQLRGWYRPTAKNNVVKDLYREHAFVPVCSDHDGATLWELDVIGLMPVAPSWLSIRRRSPATNQPA